VTTVALGSPGMRDAPNRIFQPGHISARTLQNLAIESACGLWEVLPFGTAELTAPGRYRLTRLLRGKPRTILREPSTAEGAPLCAAGLAAASERRRHDRAHSGTDSG
jgi:hypothetical protein